MKSCYMEISPGGTDCEKNLPPIIFLHAMYDAKRTWKKVGPGIVENTGRKAFALDARNHGGSPNSSEMNYDVLPKDVLEFMDTMKIQRAVIVGHSMGGRTAINLALKHPERVDALVVEDMTPSDIDSAGLKLVPVISKVALEMLKKFPPEKEVDAVKREMSEMLMMMFGKEHTYEEKMWKYYDPGLIPIIREGKSFVPEVNVKPMLSMLKRNTLVQNLPGQNLVFEGDALFLYGSKPFFDLKKDTSVRQLFPKALVKKIEGSSHLMHYDSPDEFSEAVSDFIRQLSAEPSTPSSGELACDF